MTEDTNFINPTHTDKTTSKRKICIISNSTEHTALLSSVENQFTNSTICMYRSPEATMDQMLVGLENKLNSFTRRDYCVLMFGDVDFITTKNYEKATTDIMNVIGKLNHTNFILQLPTFTLYEHASLYNCRVEVFNNLLYRKILYNNKENVFSFDTNAHVFYEMYSTYTQRLNKYGLQYIMNKLGEFITDLTNYQNIYTKRTIPYYFKNIKKVQLDIGQITNKEKLVKGTIPYYFKSIKDVQSKTKKDAKNQFFR